MINKIEDLDSGSWFALKNKINEIIDALNLLLDSHPRIKESNYAEERIPKNSLGLRSIFEDPKPAARANQAVNDKQADGNK